VAAPKCAQPLDRAMARKPKRPPRTPAIRARRPIAPRPRTARPVAALDLHRCEQFLLHEARLLDEAKFDDWLALFTSDAWYWVPSEPDQPDPHQTVSLIYDDRRLLETRVRRLASPRMYSQEPRSRTSRIVGNVTIEANDRTSCTVRSKFIMIEYRREQQRVFSGTALHRLVHADGRVMIAWKRVDLLNCDAALDGITIPF
jgi:benzoate/toluate 1,2-dioxygenase beta subunit